MHDDEPFLRAILASPGDEAVRSIYADWLDERGESAKAEYLRIDTRGLARITVGAWTERDEERAAGSSAPPTFEEAQEKWRRDVPRRQQIETLRRSIDPAWWNFMETLGCAPEPFYFFDRTHETLLFAPDAPPFAEPLVARGQVLTFGSSFRSDDAWDEGLSADLELLLRRPKSTITTVFNIFLSGPLLPFIVEAPRLSRPVDAADVRAVLRPRPGTNGEPAEIHDDASRQRAFPSLDRIREATLSVAGAFSAQLQDLVRRSTASWQAPFEAIHDDLRQATATGGESLWYGSLPCTGDALPDSPTRPRLHFGVGRSPRGPRLLGFLAHVPPIE